jgi:hypothetical protein
MRIPLLYTLFWVQQAFAAMLYNGLQKQIISSNLSNACDAAFNTTIDCAEDIIQFVTYSIQSVSKYQSTYL